MRVLTTYVAFDGRPFETAEACKGYEAQQVEAHVAGLTIDQVRDAIAGKDVSLRDALEEVGRRCSVSRRDAGVFRRKPRAPRDTAAIKLASDSAAPTPAAPPEASLPDLTNAE